MMSLIYETKNFTIVSEEHPLVSREDGGHITINPKVRIADCSMLTPKLAIEQMYLTILTGEAMTIALNHRGIDVGRINYQDNGNWGVFKPEGPYLHVHIYGRAKSAKIQKYGESLNFPFRETGFYDNCEPLNQKDLDEIQKQIDRLVKSEKYSLSKWDLK